MGRVLEAIGVFWGYLAAVRLEPLALAVGAHVLRGMCTSRAWRNVLAAAYPGERVRWRSIYAAYVSGVGANALLPARAGDALRLYVAHRTIPGASYITLVGSTAVLAIVDGAAALLLLGWALTQGVLPGLDLLPSLPSFDFAWLLRHDLTARILLGSLAASLVVLAIWGRRRLRELRARLGQAFSILRTPRRYLRRVASWQLADWLLRLVAIWFFLGAFGIDQSVRSVLLVQATLSLATLVPVSPGGIGTEQAFLVLVLSGEAPRTALLAFSVGMRVTLTAVNALLGAGAMLLTLRTVRFRRAAQAGASSAELASRPPG